MLACAVSQSMTGLALCAWHGQPKAMDVTSGICSRPACTEHQQVQCCHLFSVIWMITHKILSSARRSFWKDDSCSIE